MNGLLQDLRVSARSLQKKPGFALLAILILALGSGATTVIFTLISSVLLKPLAYPQPERLVTLHVQTETHGDRWGFSYLDFLDTQRECRSFEGVAAWSYDGGGTVTSPGEPEYVEGRFISSGLLSVLRIPLAYGRAFVPEDEHVGSAPVVIISARLWKQRYSGKPGAVGMPLTLEGKTYTIVGIAPAGFQLDGEPDVFIPLGQNDLPRMRVRGAHFIRVIARLRPEVTLAQAQTELAVVSRGLAQQYPDSNAGITEILHPLQSDLVKDVKSTLWLLLGTVGVVLLIACVNVASLLLTRVVSRQHEFALRLALGAPGRRLLQQCLTESGVLGICGGLFGLTLAAVGTRPFIRFWPDGLPRADEVHVDWRVLVFAITCSVLTGLIFGVVPALRANHSSIEETLRSRSRSVATGAHKHLNGFVICQIALALVLLSAAAVLGRTFLRLSGLNPGIDIHNVLAARVAVSPATASSPAKGRADWENLLESMRRTSGVQSVALTDIVPMREGENVLNYSPTATRPLDSQSPEALASAVSPDYLQVMHLPLVRGRFFDENDRLGNTQVVVIDEHMARHAFGYQDPVGRLLWIPALGDRPVQVVGVVGHVRHWGLAGDDLSSVQDQCYYPLFQVPDNLVKLFSSVLSIVVRTEVPPLNMVETLKRQARGAAGDQTLYEARTMEQLASGSLAQQRFLLLLFGLFSGLALLLACVGIYGVMTHLTSERVPEFGVRMALGANPGTIVRLVLGKSLLLIFAGVGIGVAASFATGRVLQRFVPVARAPFSSTFAVALPLLIGVALFASYIPARRAGKVDPMVALRDE